MKAPNWCRHPVIYSTVFLVALLCFYALYPLMWVGEKLFPDDGDDRA
jgi:hypothetical protein